MQTVTTNGDTANRDYRPPAGHICPSEGDCILDACPYFWYEGTEAGCALDAPDDTDDDIPEPDICTACDAHIDDCDWMCDNGFCYLRASDDATVGDAIGQQINTCDHCGTIWAFPPDLSCPQCNK